MAAEPLAPLAKEDIAHLCRADAILECSRRVRGCRDWRLRRERALRASRGDQVVHTLKAMLILQVDGHIGNSRFPTFREALQQGDCRQHVLCRALCRGKWPRRSEQSCDCIVIVSSKLDTKLYRASAAGLRVACQFRGWVQRGVKLCTNSE